jgi:hypothetical protein
MAYSKTEAYNDINFIDTLSKWLRQLKNFFLIEIKS